MNLVSVITPTWRRHDLLLNRCIPSVVAQTHPKVEHLVVSDGPDKALRALLADQPVTYLELKTHDEHPSNYGSRARNYGLKYAAGDLIAYLDDDNAYRPEHLEALVAAVEATPDADFAYSQLVTHPQGTIIGTDPPRYGGIDTSMILHRRTLHTRWPDPTEIRDDKHAPDWALVASWLAAGATWTYVPRVTVDYHFAGS